MNKTCDVIIIGGGPGGASCAQWIKKLGYQPCIIEKTNRLGGLQNSSPYKNEWIVSTFNKTGIEIANDIERNIVSLNIDFLLNQDRVSIKKNNERFNVQLKETAIYSEFLVLATGVSPRRGGLSPRVGTIIGGGNIIKDTDFGNKKVAILGGGDSALENYLFIRDQKPRSLKIFARTIRARFKFLELVPKDDIVIGAYSVNQEKRTVNNESFDYLIVLYGYEANLNFLDDSIAIDKNEKGFVIVNEKLQTSVENVYAIGELTHKNHPCCLTSMAEGAWVAKTIQAKLEKDKGLIVGRFNAAA